MLNRHTRIYDEMLAAIGKPDTRYLDSEGGTRSGKTFAALQLLIVLAKGAPDLIISVVSETMPHLKRGAIRDFQTIMGEEFNPYAWNKTESIYTFPSGSIIEFFSADNAGKVHGPARDILFINEGNHIDWDTARQLFVRTRDLIIVDYNPTHSFWMHEKVASREGCVHFHSTYLDNKDNLTKEQIAEIESNRGDENWWRVYGEGKVGQLEGLIFPNIELIDTLPDDGNLREIWGLDFGFSSDPSALSHNLLDTGRKIIYTDEVFYQRGMLNSDMAAAMEAAGVPKHSKMIFADCAEPKTIAELASYGWNVLPCYKATRKAEQLQMMRGYKICVTKRSLNAIKELRNYCWMQDKDGRWLNEPQAFNDHFCDCLRYATCTYLISYANAGQYTLGYGD